MRLERKRDAELARRRGLTIKTIIAVIWFGLCFIGAYYLVNWLADSGIVTINALYNRLHIPRTVSEEVVRAGLMILIVVLINFFVLLGFAFASPIGRLRPGKPTVSSRDSDPNADSYDRG